MSPRRESVFAQEKSSTSAQARVRWQSTDEEEVLEDEVNTLEQEAWLAVGRMEASAGEAPTEPKEPTNRIILPLVYGLLEQAGQWLLKAFQKDFLQRYGGQISEVKRGAGWVENLKDPQLSLPEKLDSLSKFIGLLGEQKILEKEWVSHTQDLLKNFQEAVTTAHQASKLWKNFTSNEALATKIKETLHALHKLLSNPLSEQIVPSESLAPIVGWLQMAQEWSAWLLPLSEASWDSPQAFFDVLQRNNLLPTWVSESVQKVQNFYQALTQEIEEIRSTADAATETLDKLHAYMDAFKEAGSISEQLSVLIETLADKDVAPLVERYAPAELHSAFQLFSLGSREIQALPAAEGSVRTTLLGMQRLMHPAFGKQLAQATSGGGAGAHLNTMLTAAHSQLIPSQTMVSAINLLVHATDHKFKWTAFAKTAMGEVAQMPGVQGVALGAGQLAVNYASGFGQAGKALVALLSNKTFWEQYSRTVWSETPAWVMQTILTDLGASSSHIGQIADATTGIPVEALRQVGVFLYQLYQTGERDITMLCARAGQALKASADKAVAGYAWILEKSAALGVLWKVWEIITAPDSERAYKAAKPQLDKLKDVLPVEIGMASALLEGLSWAPLLVEIKKMSVKLPDFAQQESWLDWGSKLLEIAQGAPLLQKQIVTLLEPWLSKLPSCLQASMQFAAKEAGLDATITSSFSSSSYSTQLIELLRWAQQPASQLMWATGGKMARSTAQVMQSKEGKLLLGGLVFASLIPGVGAVSTAGAASAVMGGSALFGIGSLLGAGGVAGVTAMSKGSVKSSQAVWGAGAGGFGLVGLLLIAAAIQGARERHAKAKAKASAINDESELKEVLVASGNSGMQKNSEPGSHNFKHPLLNQDKVITDEAQPTQNPVGRGWSWLKEQPYLTGMLGVLSLSAAGYAAYQVGTQLAEEEQHSASIEKWLRMPTARNRDETYLDEIYDLLINEYGDDNNLFDDDSQLQTALESIVKEVLEDDAKLFKGITENPVHGTNSRRKKKSLPEHNEQVASEERRNVEDNLVQNVPPDEIAEVAKDKIRLMQKFTQAYNNYVTYSSNKTELEKQSHSEEYKPLWHMMRRHDELLSALYEKREGTGKEAILRIYDTLIATFETDIDLLGKNPLIKKQWKKKYLELEKTRQSEHWGRIEKIINHLFTVGSDLYEDLYNIGPPHENRLLTMRLLKEDGRIGDWSIPSDAADSQLMEIADQIYNENAAGYNKSTASELFLMEASYFYVANKIKEIRWDLNDKRLTAENFINKFYRVTPLLKLKDIYDFYDHGINPDYSMGFADIKTSDEFYSKKIFYDQFKEYKKTAYQEAHFLVTKNIVNSGAIKASELSRPPQSIVVYRLKALHDENSTYDSSSVYGWLNDVLAKDPNGNVLFITAHSGEKYVLNTLFNNFIFKKLTEDEYEKYTRSDKFDPIAKDQSGHSFFDLIEHKHKDNEIAVAWTDFTIISNIKECSLLPGWVNKLIASQLRPGTFEMNRDYEANKPSLQTLLEAKQTSVLKAKADIAVDYYHQEGYLQECLNNGVPFYKMVKRLLQDEGYDPSVADWIFDVIDAVLTLLMMALPVIAAGKAGVSAANLALKQAAHGLKGQALRQVALKAMKPHLKNVGKIVAKETTSFFLAPVGWADMTHGLIKQGRKFPRHQEFGSNGRLPEGNSLAVQPATKFEPYRQSSDTANSLEVTSELDHLSKIANDKFKESKFIKNPKENCELSIDPVKDLLKDNGFIDIKVRGMYIWSNGMDSWPSNHFVVVASKNNQPYVVDITAAQFENKGMPDLNKPLYLTESDWAKKYQEASSTKLIKYKDFDHPSDARREFHPITKTSCYPMLGVEGATRLTEPSWYKTAIEEIKAGRKKVEDYSSVPKSSSRNAPLPQSQQDKGAEISKNDLLGSAMGDAKSAVLGKANSVINEKEIVAETPRPEAGQSQESSATSLAK